MLFYFDDNNETMNKQVHLDIFHFDYILILQIFDGDHNHNLTIRSRFSSDNYFHLPLTDCATGKRSVFAICSRILGHFTSLSSYYLTKYYLLVDE